MDESVRAYCDAIAPDRRPLFDRLHALVNETHPEAALVLSYGIPAFKIGGRRLFIGAWKHGLSIYGWQADHDDGFTARHPELLKGRATIQLRPADAAAISDAEFRDLFRATLDG